MKTKQEMDRDELRPEYDFDYSKAIRGKYYKRLLEEGANVVVLEPDVAKAFGDSSSVNEALTIASKFSTFDSAPNQALKRKGLKAPCRIVLWLLGYFETKRPFETCIGLFLGKHSNNIKK